MRTCDICGKQDKSVVGFKKRGEKTTAFQYCDKCVGTKAWNKMLARALGHKK